MQKLYEVKWMIHGSTSFNFCWSTNVEHCCDLLTCCGNLLNGIEPSSIFVQQLSKCWTAYFNVQHHMIHCSTFVEQQLQHLLLNKSWTVYHWLNKFKIFYTSSQNKSNNSKWNNYIVGPTFLIIIGISSFSWGRDTEVTTVTKLYCVVPG